MVGLTITVNGERRCAARLDAGEVWVDLVVLCVTPRWWLDRLELLGGEPTHGRALYPEAIDLLVHGWRPHPTGRPGERQPLQWLHAPLAVGDVVEARLAADGHDAPLVGAEGDYLWRVHHPAPRTPAGQVRGVAIAWGDRRLAVHARRPRLLSTGVHLDARSGALRVLAETLGPGARDHDVHLDERIPLRDAPPSVQLRVDQVDASP